MASSSCCLFVRENNRGLSYLKDGDIFRARKCFADALRGAQIGLVTTTPTTPAVTTTTPGPVAVETRVTPTTQSDEQHVQQQQPHVVPVEDTTSSNNNESIREQLFSRLCVLPTSDLNDQALSIFIDSSQLSSANMALIYAAIIYNMGLVYHVRGMNTNNNNTTNTTTTNVSSSVSSTSALSKAMELYTKSLSIIMVELQAQQVNATTNATPTQPTQPRNPIIDLLRMALLRHMADIYLSMSEYEQARSIGHELSKFIMTVGCFIYPDTRVTELMQTQVGCFLMYSLSLQQCSLLAPAA